MILIFNETNVSGGSEKVLTNLVDDFVLQDHQITAIFNKSNPVIINQNITCHYVHTPFDFTPRIEKHLVRIFRASVLKIFSYFTSTISIIFYLFKYNPTSVYIHSGGFPSGFMNTAVLVGLLLYNIIYTCSCKLTFAIHSIILQSNKLIYLDWLLLSLNSLNSRDLKFIFVSKYSQARFLECYKYYIFENRCSIIHNFINTDKLHPALKFISLRNSNVSSGNLTRYKSNNCIDLALVGYIDSVKDQVSAVDFFLRNYFILSTYKIPINLHIYGVEKCRYSYMNLQEKINQAQCAEYLNVYTYGAVLVEDIPYHSFHYLVSFSNMESYPLSLVESISFGTPCICNNVGGVSEIITNDLNGYLFNKSSLDKVNTLNLFNIIMLPIRDPPKYKNLSYSTIRSAEQIQLSNSQNILLYSNIICN